MGILSKEIPHGFNALEPLHYTCYEIGHTWNPSCTGTILNVFRHGFVFSSRVYFPLYLITNLPKFRKKKYRNKETLIKIFRDALQSSFFLTMNAVSFMTSFCMFGKIVGHFNGLFGFIIGMTSTAFSIPLERKSRRGMLALYILNLASESVFKMAVSRNMITPTKNFEVYLFAVTSAVYMSLFRIEEGLPPFIQSPLQWFLGDCDAARNNEENIITAKSESKSALVLRYKAIMQYLDRLLIIGPKHELCKHELSCVGHAIKSGIRNFAIGYGVQLLLNAKQITKGIWSRNLQKRLYTNVQLASFLGGFTLVFRVLNCAMRHILKQDRPQIFGAIAGLFAGLTSYFYKSTDIALYMFFKLLEILCFKGIKRGILPYFYHGDIVIYIVAMSLLFHCVILEPHNMRPSYYKFLCGLSHNKFPEMFRLLLDPIGTNASKMYPTYIPALDQRFVQSPYVKDVMKRYASIAVKSSLS